MLAMCFVSCSDDDDNSSSSSSSNTTASSITVGSKYKGTMTASGQTVYITGQTHYKKSHGFFCSGSTKYALNSAKT